MHTNPTPELNKQPKTTPARILAERLTELRINKLPAAVMAALTAKVEQDCRTVIQKKINPTSVAKIFATVVQERGCKGTAVPLPSGEDVSDPEGLRHLA